MSNKLNKKRTNFAAIPNDLLNDINISLSAKGIYSFMSSKPDNWNFTIRSMAKQLKEGETAIRSALNELKESGWLFYTKNVDGSGTYNLEWERKAAPLSHNAVLPCRENPRVENPMKGKPTRISKKEPLEKKIDSKEPTPRIQYQQIVDEYNETATNLPKVKILTDKRKARIKKFWDYSEKHQSIEFYRGYFSHANQVPFLTGNNDRKWRADLEFLMSIDNLAKILEGKYEH